MSKPHTSRWSLFFSRFNFILSYRPGSRNVQPDALSRQYQKGDSHLQKPVAILPGSRVVGALMWDTESHVWRALEDQPGPSACPEGRLYVPENLRSQVLQWAHDSHPTYHPGAGRTSRFLAQRFWW